MTRRCDVDQAPRGPLARRTHLTGYRPGARAPSILRRFDLCGARCAGNAGAIEDVPAPQALEHGGWLRPAVPVTIVTTRGSEGQRDHAIGPAPPAKDQRPKIVPCGRPAVCTLRDQTGTAIPAGVRLKASPSSRPARPVPRQATCPSTTRWARSTHSWTSPAGSSRGGPAGSRRILAPSPTSASARSRSVRC